MVLETCYQNLVRNLMSILNDIEDEAAFLDMRVNPSKSMIMQICFLKTSPLFLNPIPSDISVSYLKLFGVIISSNLKWDTCVKDIVDNVNESMSFLKLLNKFNVPPLIL